MALRASTAAKNSLLSGNDLKTDLTNAKLYIYSGQRPASADEAPGPVTKLVTFSGINWNAAADKEMAILAAVAASVAVSGVAGWFRLTTTAGDPDADDTSTKTEIRYDGAISSSGGGDLNLNHVNLVAGESINLKNTIKLKFAA